MPAQITTPKNPKGVIHLHTSPRKTQYVSGEQLLALRGEHFAREKNYKNIVIVVDELEGDVAGSLRINVRFGTLKMVTFTLGWKNKHADIFIGDDSFRIELI